LTIDNYHLSILFVNYQLSIINYILFDGVCNLCNSSVRFVIKHDKNAVFKFASLQSDAGQQLIATHGLATNAFNSFILIENNKVYLESTAALRVARQLNGLLPLLYSAIIIPPFIRNSVYKYISKHRYQWFGKREECWLPTKELSERFL